MSREPLHSQLQIADSRGVVTRLFHDWLRQLVLALQLVGVPYRGVVPVSLSAADIASWFDATGLGLRTGPFRGWAIANGNNGTDDLNGKMLRFNTTQAGGEAGTGDGAHAHTGPAHTHDVGTLAAATESAHTHSTPNHQHVMPIGFDPTNVFVHGDGSSAPVYGSETEAAVNRARLTYDFAFASGTTRRAFTKSDGSGTTGAGSAHTHALSGATDSAGTGDTSTADGPAYYELVPVMRVEA